MQSQGAFRMGVNLVIPQKPNSEIGPCIDPSKLNKTPQGEQYFMPTIDDVLPMLPNVRCFH